MLSALQVKLKLRRNTPPVHLSPGGRYQPYPPPAATSYPPAGAYDQSPTTDQLQYTPQPYPYHMNTYT